MLIILCGGITEDSKPNKRSLTRCDYALTIADEFDLILTSTGRTYRKNEGSISEAQSLKNYLVERGINASKILCEDMSKCTFSNAYFSRLMVDELRITNITVLTNQFHIGRVKLLFQFVFADLKYHLSFVAAPNPVFSRDFERNVIRHEQIIIDFYKTHLERRYHLVPGDMGGIGYFIRHINPAFSGVKDKYHQELTSALQRNVDEEKLGY